jgi:sulfur-oxidizing protein SoxY
MLRALLCAVAFAAPAVAEERPNPMRPSATWEAIRGDVVGDAEILDGEGLYTLQAPFRAFDAATVPILISQNDGAPDVRRLIVVVDENPAPVAAEFEFGEAMPPLDLEMRLRVDVYSNVRAIVETTDGSLYMAGRYVRAAGGCSAPAAKDAAAALAALGQMKVRWFDDAAAPQSGGRREAQVMVRHPNYSGLQRDQITLLYIPPHFVDTLEVRQGDELLFAMTGGISISEDPTFRFTYTDTGAGDLSVIATDTEGARFEGAFRAGI